MPQKLNKAGKMQDYIPKGNGDASGEYGTSNGTNKNYTTSEKKTSKANVITENKSVVVENKGKKLTPREKIKKAIEFDKKEKYDEANKLIDEAVEEYGMNAKEKEDFYDVVASYNDPQEMFDYLDKVDKAKAKSNYVVEKNATGKGGYSVKVGQNVFTFEDEKKAKGFADKLNETRGDEDLERSYGPNANIIDGDLTGKKKQQYDDSDIRNMKDNYPKYADFSKEEWEQATKEYEEIKPTLDKLGISIDDVKYHYVNVEGGDWQDNSYELEKKIKNVKNVSDEEKENALDKLLFKTFVDRSVRSQYEIEQKAKNKNKLPF